MGIQTVSVDHVGFFFVFEFEIINITNIPGCTLHIRCICEIFLCRSLFFLLQFRAPWRCSFWSCSFLSKYFSIYISCAACKYLQLLEVHSLLMYEPGHSVVDICTSTCNPDTGYDNNFFFSILIHSLQNAPITLRFAGITFAFFSFLCCGLHAPSCFFEIQDQKFITSFWYGIKMKINIF